MRSLVPCGSSSADERRWCGPPTFNFARFLLAAKRGIQPATAGGSVGAGRVLDHARKQRGVVFIRKDEIARFALADADTPHEQES